MSCYRYQHRNLTWPFCYGGCGPDFPPLAVSESSFVIGHVVKNYNYIFELVYLL
jgi:hypothetical protein